MKSENSMEKTMGKAKRNRRAHPAREKCLAVLSVWAQKRRASTVCRELGISWGILHQWEKRALQGMLEGLGQQAPIADQPVSLGRRLERLLTGPEQGPAGESENMAANP
jgi:transposase-like protein